jgi:hypothetical protein
LETNDDDTVPIQSARIEFLLQGVLIVDHYCLSPHLTMLGLDCGYFDDTATEITREQA